MKRGLVVCVMLLGFAAAFAQNHWQRVSSGKDPFYMVDNVNDTLYGVVVKDSTLEYRRFENGFWKRFPPIAIMPGELPITQKRCKGDLYVLTPSRLLQFKSGSWNTVESGSFLLMESY